jgi:tetratricopeptide (TPR) repeat protein
MKGQWEEAIPMYEVLREELSADFTESFAGQITAYTGSFDRNPLTSLGVCYRESGDPERAEEVFQTVLDWIPIHPQTQFELALLHEEQGRMEEARAALNVALEVWETASPEYQPANDARALGSRLGG